jgi:hypothetical protein
MTTTTVNTQEMERFFALLYGDTVGDGYCLLSHWKATRTTAKGKPLWVSDWFDLAHVDWAAIARAGVRLNQKEHLYFGVTLQHPSCTPDPYCRSKNATAYVVPGLWFDLDLAYGDHKASDLPASDDDALAFLSSLEAQPSLIVHSGGGMYGYWLFDAPYVIHTEEHRSTIKHLVKRFTYTLVQAGKDNGWTLDALGDLARVLRPPGTLNHKYDKPVEVIHEGGTRYARDDFSWLRELPAPAQTTHAGLPLEGQPDLIGIAQYYGTEFVHQSRHELEGAHPFHGSSTGDNFHVNGAKGLWHCWRHGTGGDALSLIAVCEGLIPCEDLCRGALRGKTFLRAVEIANATFSAGIVLDTHRRTNGKSAVQAPQPDADATKPEPEWMAGLLRNKSDTPQQTINNLALALQHLDPWQQAGCWYDAVRERHMVGAKPVEDGDDTAAGIAIERATGIRVTNIALVGRAMDYVCRQQPRDLLQEWVAQLPTVEVTALLTTWLRTYAHVSEAIPDAYVEDVSRIGPVGVIARIVRPGCQFRYVIVLEGDEDAGKSELVKALAGEDEYGNSWYVPLSAHLENKEAHMMLDGALLAELADLSSYTKTDESRMKALVTARTDSYIPKFSNKRADHPRRTIFIATVNPEGDGAYLKGQTGNTRYLPIPVHKVDLAGFGKIRTQLFAEAKAYYHAHPDDWWQLGCGDDAAHEREIRRQPSLYEGPELQTWLNQRRPAECTWQDVATLHLQIPKDRWNKVLQMEISKALRAHHWGAQRTSARRYWAPLGV